MLPGTISSGVRQPQRQAPRAPRGQQTGAPNPPPHERNPLWAGGMPQRAGVCALHVGGPTLDPCTPWAPRAWLGVAMIRRHPGVRPVQLGHGRRGQGGHRGRARREQWDGGDGTCLARGQPRVQSRNPRIPDCRARSLRIAAVARKPANGAQSRWQDSEQRGALEASSGPVAGGRGRGQAVTAGPLWPHPGLESAGPTRRNRGRASGAGQERGRGEGSCG